ncbi:MAG: 3'-5' exonuclease [Bacteroidota bacterium]|nr:3'-5' exonuclease [Bacteroidota bacterium]
MLNNINLSHLLVIDIETVSQKANFNELDEDWQELWSKKVGALNNPEIDASLNYDRAAIYAEFGKIVCIGVGAFHYSDGQLQLRVKSIHGHNEKSLLNDFNELLNKHYNGEQHALVAHNGREFDFPYICRRLLINGLEIPRILDISGKKPWEVKHLDTMDLWKFGDYKNYTSLNVLAKCFGIPSPKDDIDGSMVGHTYWQQDDLNRIAVYCKKDIVTTAQVLLKYKNLPMLKDEQVFVV